MASTGGKALFTFGLQGEVDHHDGVLLYDSYKEKDANQRHDAEIGSSDEQCKDRADSGGRKRGENRERMNQALIQNAQHDVDGDESGKDEVWLVLERILKGLRGALESGVNGGGHSHVALSLFERGYGIAQGDIGGEIEM